MSLSILTKTSTNSIFDVFYFLSDTHGDSIYKLRTTP